MFDADRALYANHRRFLEAQRGALSCHAGFDLIHGDIPAFKIAMLHEAGAAVVAAQQSAFVFAPPWAAPAPSVFSTRAYQLTHMSLPRSAMRAPAALDAVEVEIVRDEAGLAGFTGAQAAGFAQNPEAYADLYAWMWDKNLRALPLDDQRFYVLRSKGEAVSVLLTVDSGDALGIYAVATPPALRKRGLSSQLLAHVCSAASPQQQICLQVMRGSDAERLYGKLGFVERFVVDVYATGGHGP